VVTGLLRLRADATRDWETRETKTRPGLSGPNRMAIVYSAQLPNIGERRASEIRSGQMEKLSG